ncbi:MAG: acyl-CoA dehydrogenase family protein [Myxococcota bacterium]
MDFNFEPKEEAFRAEVRKFIEENKPEKFDPYSGRDQEVIATWNRKLAEKHWIGFSWPKEEGGGGGSLLEQFILKEEMSAAKAPPLGSDFMGLQWVGPALIRHGTEEQKQRFLPDLLNARSYWCTGYSEPDTGSDLASLTTRAVLEGDHYIVNGSKIWTTAAHVAENIFLLVRTTAEDETRESRYGGITCLLAPMDTPGIEVRPIRSLVGHHSFNQTFFNDVKVPVENRLGAEGEGWHVVMGALANERSGISESTGKERELEALKTLARNARRNGRPVLDDLSVRRQIAAFETKISAMRLNGLRYLTKQLNGQHPSSETSVNKAISNRLALDMSDLAMTFLGSEGQVAGVEQARSLAMHGSVIGGGAPNIQRNIIAERILGLPKD